MSIFVYSPRKCPMTQVQKYPKRLMSPYTNFNVSYCSEFDEIQNANLN